MSCSQIILTVVVFPANCFPFPSAMYQLILIFNFNLSAEIFHVQTLCSTPKKEPPGLFECYPFSHQSRLPFSTSPLLLCLMPTYLATFQCFSDEIIHFLPLRVFFHPRKSDENTQAPGFTVCYSKLTSSFVVVNLLIFLSIKCHLLYLVYPIFIDSFKLYFFHKILPDYISADYPLDSQTPYS